MNKEEFVNLLKEHKENEAKLNIRLKELKNKRIQLKACEEIETSLNSAFGINQDIHSKNKISNKVLDRIVKNDTRKQSIQKEIEELEKTVRELKEKVDTVNDRLKALKYKEKKMLEAYYIDGRSYEDIGTNLYWELFKQTRSWESVKKTVEKAVKKMIKL